MINDYAGKELIVRKRRRGLTFGSILAMLLTVLALFGTYYFIKTVASDSPAAAMDLKDIVDAFEKPFQINIKPETQFSQSVSTILPP